MRTFHIDEPREIGKKRVRVSPKDMMVAKKDLAEKVVADNTCVNCGNIVNENLRKWFKQKWVNIGKKKRVVDLHLVEQVVRKEDTLNVYLLLRLLV